MRLTTRRVLLRTLVLFSWILFAPAIGSAQNRVFLNPGWESFTVNAGGNGFFTSPSFDWSNTAGSLEIWGSGFLGVPSQSGIRFAELNAFAAGTLYQTVCVVPGDAFTFNFWHRRRDQSTANPDVMDVVIINPTTSAEVLLGSASTNGNAWTNYTRTFDATTQGGTLGILSGGTPLRVGFRAISTATGNTSVGNLLDNITLTGLVPFTMMSQASGTGPESTSNPGIRLLVNGIVSTAVDVDLSYAGTATFGTDYTAPLAVTIPAGTYDGTVATGVLIPIAIVDDGLLESSETIVVTVTGTSDTNVLRLGPTSCGSLVAGSTYTITDTGARADLSITKSDSAATFAPGQSIIYTIVVQNAGPSDVVNAQVSDPLPPGTTASWTCSPGPGASCPASGTGAINTAVSIPANGRVSFRLTLVLPSNFPTDFANTATVTLPPGVTDPVPGNNTATDTDTRVPSADLTISKSATPNPHVPGAALTYTVVASNVGPSDAPGARIQDMLPAALAGFTWTCAGSGGATCGTPSGTGSIDILANLPRNGTVTFTITGTVPPAAAGTLTNTATVTSPAGVSDPAPGNNSASHTSGASIVADLTASKSSAPNPYVPGSALTYTVVVSNLGPSQVTGAAVQDAVPSQLGVATWTCVAGSGAACGAASGSGSINTTVDLGAGAHATFTITGTVPPATRGAIMNTVTIAPPAGSVDPVPGNNQASDSNPAGAQADVAVTKTSTPNPYVPGSLLTYTITVQNNGPSTALGTRVQDAIHPALSAFTWTCTAGAGATCVTASGTGDIDALVSLDVGAIATFTITGIVPPSMVGVLTNTATATLPPGVTDPVPGNNQATTDNPSGPQADLSILKSSTPNPYVPGLPLTYTVSVTNDGPSSATNARVQDALPPALAGAGWTCVTTGGGICGSPSGTGDIDALVTLPPNATATFSITGTVPSSTMGPLVNSATVTPPAGVGDPVPGNNTSTVTTPPEPHVDLGVTKISAPNPYVPGAPLTYTIVVQNAGPSAVTDASVQDTLPAALAGFTWTCAGANGGSCGSASGSGSIASLVSLPVGGTATFTVTGTVPSNVTGALNNTVTVTPPVGTIELAPVNNTATDTNSSAPRADLTISKSTSPDPYTPGLPVGYLIVVHNVGPSDVTGARVQDALPVALTNVTWTCAGSGGGACPVPSGTGNIDLLVDLASGGTVTFTISADTPGAPVQLDNTVTVTPPAGVTDPVPGNNQSTASNPSSAQADLTITKSGAPNPYVPGAALTYTIVATNLGPSDAIGARVQDALPSVLAGFTWTCMLSTGGGCGSGAGSIDQTLTLLAGTSATFTVTGTVPSNTTGPLDNTATITPPTGVADPVPGNNQARVTDPADPRADLVISKTSTPNPFVAGALLTYTVVVTNVGPSDVANARVQDALPSAASGFSWTCTPSTLAACGTADGVGSIDALVTLPAGETATFTITGIVPPGTPAGPLANTATVTAPPGVTDPLPGNNQDTDVNSGVLRADLSIVKSSSPNPYVPGTPLTYTIAVTNAGPSDVTNARVQDALPPPIAGFTWTCTAMAGGSCGVAGGTGDIDALVTLPAGVTATFTLTGTVPSSSAGALVNIATITPPFDVTDPTPGNNQATDTNAADATADLQITKSGTPDPYVPGAGLTYTIVVTNAGPSDAPNARVQDALPPELSSFTWTCTPSGTATCLTPSGAGDLDTFVSLPAGTSVTFSVTGTVPASTVGALLNTATVTPPPGVDDPIPGNNTASNPSIAHPQANLAIVKTASPNPYVPGLPLTYTIVATNAGPSDAVFARVQDALPPAFAGFTWICTASGPAVCHTPSGTGDINALVNIDAHPAASVTFTITGIAPSSVSGPIANTVTIAPRPGTDDPTPGNNTSTTTTPGAPSADLSITKTASPSPYIPGAALTYTITVSNAGPSDVSGATVTDTVPPALAGFGWTCTAGPGSACLTTTGVGDINAQVDLDAGSFVTFTLTGTSAPDASGSLVNVASVAPPAGTTDPTPGNNTGTSNTPAAPTADLSILKTGPPAPYQAGSPLIYTILVSNNGPSTATNARVVDPLPAPLSGFTWTCAASGGGSCGTSAGTGNIDILVTLPPSASAVFTVTGTTPASATGPIVNTAEVTAPAGTTDPNAGNNTSTVTGTVTLLADIALTKTVDNATPSLGTTVRFTITALNRGPSPSGLVRIVDAVPSGLTLLAGTPSIGTFTAATGEWIIPALAAGASATLTIDARVDATGARTNVATIVQTAIADPDTSNNTASASLNAPAAADLQVAKMVDRVDIPIGDVGVFTVTVRNAGPDAATGVVVNDLLPVGLTVIAATPSAGTYDPATGAWTIGAIANGGAVTLTVTATVDLAGTLTNTARVTAVDQFDPAPGNNAGGVSVNGLSADIQVVKTADRGTVTVGDSVTFTITTTNLGPGAATGIRVREALPAGLVLTSWTVSQGVYVPETGIWDVGNLAAAGADSRATLTVVATVAQAGRFTNTATVIGRDLPDPVPTNDTTSIGIDAGATDLGVGIEFIGDADAVGRLFDFFVTVTNRGTSPASDPVVVAIPFPDELEFTAPQTTWPCEAVGRTLFCEHELAPPLEAGQGRTVAYWADVLRAFPRGLAAYAHVASEEDTDVTNSVGAVLLTPPASASANLRISQTITSPGPATVGTPVTYRVVVTNDGPDTATDVTLIDVLPHTLTFVSITPEAGTCDGAQRLACRLGALAPDQQVVITIVARVAAPGAIPHAVSVSGREPDPDLTNNAARVSLSVAAATSPSQDTDHDGLPDLWESQMGISPVTANASDDPDGDGLTNAQEYARHSHPRGFFREYFAEGASNAFFGTQVSVFNPAAATAASVVTTVMPDGGAPATHIDLLGPRGRLDFDPATWLGRAGTFATMMESDMPLAADRLQWWDARGYGSAAERGQPAASTRWLFAEGATTGTFGLFYLIENPSSSAAADVTLRFLLPDQPPVEYPVSVAPMQRMTIWVNQLAETRPRLRATEMGAEVFSTNGVPIVVERAMYRDAMGQVFGAGHDGAGATSASATWYFAEGATGDFFDMYLLLANPLSVAANVTVTYLLPDGGTVMKTYTLAAQTRRTISVEGEDPRLASTPVAMSVASDQPIVAERAMWWPGPAFAPEWYETHVSLGATATAPRWAVAGVRADAASAEETFVLVANTGSAAGQARMTISCDNGATMTKAFALPATSRTTVPVGATFAEADGQSCSALVESLGAAPAPLVVEYARYRSLPGQIWAAGAAALATPVP